MIKIREAIVVEGRYDKNTLSQIVDTVIIETGGFSIFNDRERLEYLRKLSERRGLIIFTDSDGAGFVIRRYLKGAIDPKAVRHAYIPDIPGREKRKSASSKEGKLGVEGMPPEVIINALRSCGATFEKTDAIIKTERLTKADLYADGLLGGENSACLRAALLGELALPKKLGTNAMLEALNIMCTIEEYRAALEAARIKTMKK